MARRSMLVAALVSLGACSAPPGVPMGAGADPRDIPREIAVAGTTEEVERRVEAVMGRLGLTADGGARLHFTGAMPEPRRWAFCRTLHVGDGDRRRSVRPRGAVTDVTVEAMPTAEDVQMVRWDVRFVGRYRSPRNDGTIERPCRSFGVLETALVRALRG